VAIDDGHRKVSPGRESTGTDFYTVLQYYPDRQTCDLAPASTNQRGVLKSVPIAQPFGGAWELQSFHEPKLDRVVNSEHWGECPRGARWGQSLPIQQGDMARVSFAGEGQCDPIIVGFMRWRGDYGIPWVANQALSVENDYTKSTPPDDDVLNDRWDVLLPSGAWIRSTESGSWTIATAPVHRAIAFISLGYDGKITIKSRDDASYKVHMEFDAIANYGRIAIGELESSSFIEFRDGNINIRAAKDLNLYGANIFANCGAGGGSGSGAGLENLPTHDRQPGETDRLLTQNVGELTLQGADPTQVVSQVTNAPGLSADVSNELQGLTLEPDRLQQGVLDSFKPGMDTTAIAPRLTQLVGADVISGKLSEITSPIDFGSRFLAKQTGLPSWTLRQIPGILGDGKLPSIMTLLPEMSDRDILSQISHFAGTQLLNGLLPPAARNALQTAVAAIGNPGLSDRVAQITARSRQTPILYRLENGDGFDLISTVSQILGRYCIGGGNLLGGVAKLFDRDLLKSLPLPDVDLNKIQSVASQIENFFSNPHAPIDIPDLTAIAKEKLGQLSNVAPEIRDLLGKIPVNRLPLIQDMAKLSPSVLAEQFPFPRDATEELGSLLATVPQSDRDQLANFEGAEILGKLPSAVAQELVVHPQAIDSLPAPVIRGLFGNGGGGLFHIRTGSKLLVTQDPRSAQVLDRIESNEFHKVTEATEIERFAEYGELNMPDYWSD
jgi:hypothetical protein